MAEQKMISIEKVDEIIKEHFPAECTKDWHGQELVIRRYIPYDTEIEIVRKVADACFHPETGEYMPEVKEFALKVCMIEAFTNVRLPQNVEHQCAILYGTDLWNEIAYAIEDGQYYDIRDAVDDRIRARNNANRVMFENEIQRGIDAMQRLGDHVSELFEGVTPEDVSALISAIGQGGIDEGKIAEAVVAEQNRLRGEELQEFEVIEGEAAENAETDGE